MRGGVSGLEIAPYIFWELQRARQTKYTPKYIYFNETCHHADSYLFTVDLFCIAIKVGDCGGVTEVYND